MVNWITLQETAEKVGVRKGTLCMWRNRNKFPFKTKGKGRALLIDEESVNAWYAENKNKLKTGRSALRKPMAKKKAGRPVGRPAGRPAKAAKVTRKKRGRRGRVAAKRIAPVKGNSIVIHGDLDLKLIQGFVTDIQSGSHVDIAPTKDGFRLTTMKS